MANRRGFSGQDMRLGGLGMANSKSSDYNLISSGTAFALVGLVLVSRDKDLYHLQTYHTWLEPATGYRSWLVTTNLHSELSVDSLIPSMQQRLGIQQKRTCVPLSLDSRGGSCYSRWEGSQYFRQYGSIGVDFAIWSVSAKLIDFGLVSL